MTEPRLDNAPHLRLSKMKSRRFFQCRNQQQRKDEQVTQ